MSGAAPFDFSVSGFLALCEGRSRGEVIDLAKREDRRAYAARHRVSGRGARARSRELQTYYEDAMGKVLHILEYGGPGTLSRQQLVLQPLIDRLLSEPGGEAGLSDG